MVTFQVIQLKFFRLPVLVIPVVSKSMYSSSIREKIHWPTYKQSKFENLSLMLINSKID